MQIELTDEQQQQILEAHDHEGEPLRVVNPRTNQAFVLLSAETYERLRSAFVHGYDPREAYPLVDRLMSEDDANDPHLASYHRYDRETRSLKAAFELP